MSKEIIRAHSKVKLPLSVINDLNADLNHIYNNYVRMLRACLNNKYENVSQHDKSIINYNQSNFMINMLDNNNDILITRQLLNNQRYLTRYQMVRLIDLFSVIINGYSRLSSNFKDSINSSMVINIIKDNLMIVDNIKDNILKSYGLDLDFDINGCIENECFRMNKMNK